MFRDSLSSNDTLSPSDGPSRVTVSRGRSVVVHTSLVLFAIVILARTVHVQLVDNKRWAEWAVGQQTRERRVTPPRGTILDANGNVLVESRELVRVIFTPKNFRVYKKTGAKKSDPPIDTRAVVRRGLKALEVDAAVVRKVMDSTRVYAELPKLYLPGDVERFKGLPGVELRTVLTRQVSAPSGIVGMLGAVRNETSPVGGLELELDSILRGVDGRSALLRDGRGHVLETPSLVGVEARPGHTVTLSINQALQDLVERELAEGVQRTGSSGGDVVIIDARDGAVLAMAGVRDRKPSVTATSLAEAYEPGSVMKPFVISRALELGLVRSDEQINTEGGKFVVARRTVDDEHKAAFMSVPDVIRLSSNIGTIKIAMRMSEREEYESLRDFGFGTPTGLPYPAESRGRLAPPKWHPQTAASFAMGYELMATPMQLAAAYAAIANGGELLQPAIVREIRDYAGNVVFTHERQVVRRAMQPETAALMRTILASVVDSGTALAADLSTYDVAGKSGTARMQTGGGYNTFQYNSTFAGMFPVQSPQFVLVVRLIDPRGKIYGGTVAGAIVNEILQGALATREASLDRRALAAVAKPLPVKPIKPRSPQSIAAAQRDSARFDSLRAPAPPPAPAIAAPSRVVVSLPLKAGRGASSAATDDAEQKGTLRTVPSVYGLDVRQAVRTLQSAGFQVSIAYSGAMRTRPAAGTLARGGSVVVLETMR